MLVFKKYLKFLFVFFIFDIYNLLQGKLQSWDFVDIYVAQ